MSVRLPIEQRGLSVSEARCFRECPRKHHNLYMLKRRPRTESEPLRFGSLTHRVGLNTWWNSWRTLVGSPDLVLDVTLAAIESEDADEFDKARVSAIMIGYHERWAGQIMEVIEVEHWFEAPLVNPSTGAASRNYRLHGRIDALVRMESGVYVVEHKTSSDDISQGSDYWRQLRLDSQVSIYLSGAKQLDYELAGCIYDVIGKPKQRPYQKTPDDSRKYTKDGRLYANQREVDESPEEFKFRVLEAIAEDPDKYFQRGTVVRLEAEASEAAADMWLTAKSIREAERLGQAPRNPDACFGWGSACAFFDCCTGVADINDPLRFKDSSHEN